MKKLLPLVIIFLSVYIGWSQIDRPNDYKVLTGQNDKVLTSAFEERKSGFQTEGTGIVIKVLPDDDEGSRHQRFILRLNSGQTLMIAHNIDLAPRLPSLRKGDTVAFNGEYEWNSKGGVIHWTHRDTNGRHVAGWLKYKGRLYQ